MAFAGGNSSVEIIDQEHIHTPYEPIISNYRDLIRVVISTKHDPFNPFLNPESLSILRRPALVCQQNKCLNAYPPYARAEGLA